MCTGRLICDSSSDGDGGTQMTATIQKSLLRHVYLVRIYCYDCDMKRKVQYHYLGLECPICRGFNTRQLDG
jgi:hypothetical protein